MYQHGGDIYTHKNMIDFSSNINPLGPPDGVITAACEGIRSVSYYPDPWCNKLRERLSKMHQLPKEYILCGNGAAELIFSFVLAYKPKKALFPIPTFHEYEQALHTIDCDITYYSMKEENDFILTDDFIPAITNDLDIIFLCNPNNPTGHLIPNGLLDQILQKCVDYNIYLVIDECFMDFVNKEEQDSFIEKCTTVKTLFILKAFTKLYAIPGLRLGYMISSNTEMLMKMKEVTQPWNVSVPAQLAGIAALEEEEYVNKSIELILQERKYLMSELSKMNLKLYDSKGNYIFFQGDKGLYEECLNKGILIRDCSNYEGLEQGYYRIAVKDHISNEKLVHILQEVI
ncbi:L-threonine O-3-phosphate decarboxylase [Mobilisporobacter senegalensis]|uniref:L-threonine O-3-phosphate decarboxylase n=1 Tax=Mobilisporobacter senegalensis TaxID=1329262 RepID=A0A3N1Y2Y7_9FIRM|nr:histidinol-phosphate transaminase [Mobilisporobacter senegalensis]ROR31637.1 L-threonine O-3-phosphate decarboxylase [Mobilisporobacter senegalensis]